MSDPAGFEPYRHSSHPRPADFPDWLWQAEVFCEKDITEIAANDISLPAKQPFMAGSRDQEVFGLGEPGSLSNVATAPRRASGRDDEL
jgi:hypothetical protein